MKIENVGDKIPDCFMGGIGGLDHISNEGVVEAFGKDWVVIRDLVTKRAILIDRSIEELNEFLK